MKDEFVKFEKEEFFPYLEQLIWMKRMLRMRSTFILTSLFASLISMACFAFIHSYNVKFKPEYISNQNIYMELSSIIATFSFIVIGIASIVNFNSLRDRGMIIYEEITDEIDWSRKRKEFINRPPIELRIVIKEFLKSTDLPFTTGKNGQGLYFLFFILISISTILIKILL